MLSFTSRLMTSRIRQLGCHLAQSRSITGAGPAIHLGPWIPNQLLPSAITTTTTTTTTTITTLFTPAMNKTPVVFGILRDYLASTAIWWIKRTFQPSVLRKKRQHGYLNRSKSVGGRKILRRRRAKGRARLFGA